jgi:hypothetical protein
MQRGGVDPRFPVEAFRKGVSGDLADDTCVDAVHDEAGATATCATDVIEGEEHFRVELRIELVRRRLCGFVTGHAMDVRHHVVLL